MLPTLLNCPYCNTRASFDANLSYGMSGSPVVNTSQNTPVEIPINVKLYADNQNGSIENYNGFSFFLSKSRPFEGTYSIDDGDQITVTDQLNFSMFNPSVISGDTSDKIAVVAGSGRGFFLQLKDSLADTVSKKYTITITKINATDKDGNPVNIGNVSNLPKKLVHYKN